MEEEEEERKKIKRNKRKGGGRYCRTLTEFPRFKKDLAEKIFNSVSIPSVSLQNELSSLGFLKGIRTSKNSDEDGET
jgi:hypothetical protein